jgi:hypothetical protein
VLVLTAVFQRLTRVAAPAAVRRLAVLWLDETTPRGTLVMMVVVVMVLLWRFLELRLLAGLGRCRALRRVQAVYTDETLVLFQQRLHQLEVTQVLLYLLADGVTSLQRVNLRNNNKQTIQHVEVLNK